MNEKELRIAKEIASAIASSFQRVDLDEGIALKSIEILHRAMIEYVSYNKENLNNYDNKENSPSKEGKSQEVPRLKEMLGELHGSCEEMFENIDIRSIHITKKGNWIEVSFE